MDVNGDGLDIWVVFDHPADVPDYYVVRKQTALPDGTMRRNGQAFCFRELLNARLWLMDLGLTCLARHPDDDPTIVETWL